MIQVLLITSLTLLIIVTILLDKTNSKLEKFYKQKEKEIQVQKDKIKYFIHQVELAETLTDLYILHIKIWANGIRHENFGPDRHGMFRTDDILMMVPSEIYLGNIYGLFTLPLPRWEMQHDDDKKLVIEQYKNILISNMKVLLS